jgi:hypothetical protein
LQNKHNLSGNGSGLGKQYMGFVRANMDQVAKKINDDLYVLGIMEVNKHSGVESKCSSIVMHLWERVHIC